VDKREPRTLFTAPSKPDGWQSEWVRNFVSGATPKALARTLAERDKLKLESCPTCGAGVATIFDHLEGCPEPAQETALGTPRNA
jgi:hypothetical protein